ncbi:MAG: hypothetical protein ACHQHK_06415 [Dongiales bacterium]
MLLLGLLPLAALGLTIALFHRRGREPGAAVVLGSLAWAYATALAMEALSPVRGITFASLLIGWAIAVAVLALAVFRSRPAGRTPLFARLRSFAAGLILEEWILAGVILLIGGVTLLLALVCPPNNWDSQTYHLPRIEHWIQNGSLEFYRTHIERQLDLPGFAEVLLLPLRLLSGGDRLLNLLQWLAGAGSVVLVGRIAGLLGVSRRGVALARLAAVTLPIGILESSSTQNDLVVTFFLLCMAERLLAWRVSRSSADAAFFAMAAGLALAAKGTAYLIGFPLGLWFLAEILPAKQRAVPMLLACGLLVLLPNLPGYVRNLDYSGSPIGQGARSTNNTAFGLGPLVTNGVRNLATNLATQNSGYDRWLTRVVTEGLAGLGLDASDPRLTFIESKFEASTFQTSEDIAANPLQLLLAIAAVLVIFLPGGGTAFPRWRYALSVIGAALLFLVVLRWQPWITRLQLPIFALAAPLVGVLAFERIQGWARIGATAVLALLLVIPAMPPLWANYRRPIFPPMGYAASLWAKTDDEILFIARPDLLASYQAAVRYVAENKDSQIGLVISGNDWEYPLWRLLREQGLTRLRIEHVAVKDAPMAKPYPLGPFDPTLVIAIEEYPPAQLTIEGALWQRKLLYPGLALYRRAS